MSNQSGNHGPQAQTSEMLPHITNTESTAYFLKECGDFGACTGLITNQGLIAFAGSSCHRGASDKQGSKLQFVSTGLIGIGTTYGFIPWNASKTCEVFVVQKNGGLSRDAFQCSLQSFFWMRGAETEYVD